MKKALFFVALTIVHFSCQKKDATYTTLQSIDAAWRMITVKDNASGISTGKPSSIQGDVDITFMSVGAMNGVFSGATPTNQIYQSDFSIRNSNEISVQNLMMTKVAETSWGKDFVDHIRDAQAYSFDANGYLTIVTANNTLTFKRL